jgi:hypothetical protein
MSDLVKLADTLISAYEKRRRFNRSRGTEIAAKAESAEDKAQCSGFIVGYEQALNEVIEDLRLVINEAPRGSRFLDRISFGVGFRF